jgi:hypothetical protein
MVESLLAVAKQYQPFATWLALIVAFTALVLNYNKNRSLPVGTTDSKRRRYWPWVLIVLVATVIAWGPVMLPYVMGLALNPSTAISGTADATGNAIDVSVKMEIDMPYEAFCTTDWGSVCYAKEKKDQLVVLAFDEVAPHDGGKVEWHVTPTPPLKAYHDELNTVADRDGTIGSLGTQIDQLKSQLSTANNNVQGLNSQVRAWSAYHDRVMAVIDEIEKQDCAKTALAWKGAIDSLTGAITKSCGSDAGMKKAAYPSA